MQTRANSVLHSYTWAGSFVDRGHRWEENESFNLRLYIDLDLGQVGRLCKTTAGRTELMGIRPVIAATTNVLPTPAVAALDTAAVGRPLLCSLYRVF